MNLKHILTALGIFIGAVIWLQGSCPSAWAKLRIGAEADIRADAKAVRALESAFIRAEEAIRAEDIDTLMALYSERYRYAGLPKDDIRKTWSDLFAQYDRISTSHSFSRIVVKPGRKPTAEITCTGTMWATSHETGERVNLDSWLGEVHNLVYEDGAWRIRGNADKGERRLQFGVAPHPLF